jgi:hypothetical protein
MLAKVGVKVDRAASGGDCEATTGVTITNGYIANNIATIIIKDLRTVKLIILTNENISKNNALFYLSIFIRKSCNS